MSTLSLLALTVAPLGVIAAVAYLVHFARTSRHASPSDLRTVRRYA